MRAATSDLVSFLAAKQPFIAADLFTFTFLDGAAPTLRLASTDQDITHAGVTWFGSSPALGAAVATRDPSYPSPTRSRWNVKNTIEVPTLEIDLMSDGADYRSGVNIKQFIHNGLLDGCEVLFQRAFMPTFGDTSLGLVTLFGGVVGPVQIAARGVKITVKGANVRMQQFMPRNRYQIGCIHGLYDVGCGADRAALTHSGVVASAAVNAVTWASDPTSGAFASLGLGVITMTSGAANGSTRTILSASSTGVTLMYPFYEALTAGDTFTVTFGCDKTLATCSGRFSNTAHYRGFPYTPPATAAV